MARRKTFDPTTVPLAFWRQDDVAWALARREVGRLFAIYLGAHPDCTQTQLALLTQHDRCDVSNFVRGTRNPRVTDIDVLTRIADGLAMPDAARVKLGLAPTEAAISALLSSPLPTTTTTGWYRPRKADQPLRIAICGSRATDTNGIAIDDAVCALSRLLMTHQCEVDHGPLGVGIEIMTYIADHYRPPTLRAAVGIFGRPNVVRRADYVLVVGGGGGTLDEVELAISMGKRIIPFVASGGAARRAFERSRSDPTLRSWMPDSVFDMLGGCATADGFVELVAQIFANHSGGAISA